MSDPRHLVLLFHPRTEHEENYRDFWIPYSLLTVAAALRPNFDVTIIDENLPRRHNETLALIDSCCCVGISAMTGHQIANGLSFARLVRSRCPETPIIWGGAHATLFPEQMAQSADVDVVALGASEYAFRALVEELTAGRPAPEIPGLGWSKPGSRFNGGKAPNRARHDFPAFPWDLLPLESYVRGDEKIGQRTLNYVSSQGCPFPCGFCSEVALYERAWNALPPSRIVADVSELVHRARIDAIKFYDANFFTSVPRAMDFAERVTPLGIRWAASCHPATVLKLSPVQLRKLAASGLCRLLIGVESGSQEALDLVQKRLKVQDVPEIAQRLADVGVVGSFTFVVGFPGVGDDLHPTLELGERLRRASDAHEVKVHFYAPYPGTPMWPLALQSGFVPPTDLEGWASFDYYAVTTPWVDQAWHPIVRSFNQTHCPYVHV